MLRTRFAPSPTGSLHLGNARVAVLNWLLARRHGGAFILRIEDTDPERNLPGAEAAIMRDLRWLGLDWDEGPLEEGGHAGACGPYRQSERSERYATVAERLREAGRAYPCHCREVERDGAPVPHDDQACAARSEEERAALEADGVVPALRFRADQETDHIVVQDAVRGAVRFPAEAGGDFVLLRSDGSPTYGFAVVVDDVDMGITHVVRGAGHLSNTPRQVLLYRALGMEPPVFAHIPTVLAPEGGKLSKRAGAEPLAALRSAGVHPDAVVNYLSLLSWSSESGEDVLPRERLMAEISLERIGAGDVMHDPARLRWLSARHIEAMPLDALVAAVRPWVPAAGVPVSDEVLPAAVAGVRTHLAAFEDIAAQLRRYFPEQDAHAPLPAEEARLAGGVAVALAELPAWEEDALGKVVRAVGAELGHRGRALFEPLRTALTGEPHGPPLPTILLVQGRDMALHRLRQAAGERA
ncbi:MAG: glutamate--tRNA ligase [Gemmatimonadota bacterium]